MNKYLLSIVTIFLFWNASCCILPPGADTVHKYQNFTYFLKQDLDIQELMKIKKLSMDKNLFVTGGNFASSLYLDFYDEKKPLSTILFTEDETLFIAQKLQKVSREQKYDKKIRVREFSTSNTRYIIGPCGRYLEINGS